MRVKCESSASQVNLSALTACIRYKLLLTMKILCIPYKSMQAKTRNWESSFIGLMYRSTSYQILWVYLREKKEQHPSFICVLQTKHPIRIYGIALR